MSWHDASRLASMKAVLSEPAPPPPTSRVETVSRVRNQTREFETTHPVTGVRERSLSTSRRHEETTRTYNLVANTYSDGPWNHTGDTDRWHVHGGRAAEGHVPTGAAGVGGSTSTPAERLQLSAMPSTLSTHID